MAQASVDILWQKMGDELRAICDRAGVMGYSLHDLKTGSVQGYREDVVFPTASTIKIAVLLGLSDRVHRGLLSWDQVVTVGDKERVAGSGILRHFRNEAHLSVWDIASLMIALSDNTATNVCIDLATMEHINTLLSDLGCKDTKIRRKMMDYEAAKRGDENVSTPRDLSLLVSSIEKRRGVEDAVAQDILQLLSLPKTGAFTTGLPVGTKRANKPGGLGHLSVDAGLIYLPGRTFALSVCGSFLPGKPVEWTAALVTSAYSYMLSLATCTELGRS